MTKEEAREKLRRAESNLRLAEIVSEEHEKAIKEIKEAIEKLKGFINKPERWQDKLVGGDYIVVGGLDGLFPYLLVSERAKAEHTFKTEEQAQLLAGKMNLMQEMHAFAHVMNEGWLPDWKNEYGDKDDRKWGLAFNEDADGVYADWCDYTNPFVFGIAVKSEEIAEEMLVEFGKRIKAIYNKQY